MIRLVVQPPGAEATRNAAEAARNAADAQASADKAIENAIQAAERAVNAGAEAPPPPAMEGEPVVFSTDDGKPVSMSFKDGTIFLTQEGNTQVIPLREAIPREASQIAWAIPATLSILLIWWPLSRAVIRWLNRKHVANNEAAALEARLRDRMETLERNLDTVAVEMERLSEGQRFTNKLLTERAEKERVSASGQV
jgi:hypothetical protein